MSDKSLDQLSKAEQKEIAAKFNSDARAFESLEGYESIVFAAGDAVIKAYDASTRTKDELLAELKFINHLADSGVNVAKALSSAEGNIVEGISDYWVVKFSKAKGESPRQTDATPELFALMGQTLGKMHAASKTYTPNTEQKRNDWFQDQHVKNWQLNLDQDDPVRAVVTERYEQLLALTTDRDVYGLIHADFHSDNFLLEGETLTVIDFGDCLYGWFAMDIATAMFYFRRFLEGGHDAPEDKQQAFAELFYQSFIKAYLQENPLSTEWLELIPIFLLWRYIDLYLYISHLKQSGELDEDEQEALFEFKDIILTNKIIQLDWKGLAQ